MDFTLGRRSVVARIETRDQFSAPESAPDAESSGADFSPAEEKYEPLAPIGSGGMGEVTLVRDNDLRRDVAMKMLRPELAASAAMKRKFVAEAQATSQLEHQGIPPVHDIGLTPQGSLYFTMKVVRGDTLAAILKKLVVGVKEIRHEYTLHKLVTVMERIADAVHFAHEKGVVHRDLKPENVMLGSYGEVSVMDWGIAKVSSKSADAADFEETIRTVETDAALMTQIGAVKGTIPYMSPEQARGEPLDRRTDVYALGAILYEVLTLHPAFEGSGVQLILRVRGGEFAPVETRNPRRPVPEALAVLCRRAMSKDAAARPATALEFAEHLRAFLDGRAEKERRHREAEALAAQGREAMSRYVAARAAIDVAERAAADASLLFKPWQSVDESAAAIDARLAVDAARKGAVLSFAETTKLLEGALLAEPENAAARGLLADLWRGRLDDAERRRDRADADFAITMIRRYDDVRLAAYVAGNGSLELTSDPPGAEVVLSRFEDRRGVLRLGEPRVLGRTPLAPVALAMGSYLAVLRHPGFPDVRYPVHVTRNRAWVGHVTMRTQNEIGDGFVYVPGGPFIYGLSKDARILELPDYAITAKPVTFADWADFLAAVEREQGPDAARALVPGSRTEGSGMEKGPDGLWRVVDHWLSEPTRTILRARHGAGCEMRLPVVEVSWHEAVAYCGWKTATTGGQWRLPTEQEREKAARGVDGRAFPWGELEHASLAKCRDSREEPTQPEPVGAFPTATSVYGMIDAAGNTWDWTDSWLDARQASRVCRGSAWNLPPGFLRCGYRHFGEPELRYANCGLRAARDL